MTRGQERAAALGCLVFGVLGVWISKRPTTDIALGLLGGLGFLFFLVPSLLRSWGDAASRRRVMRRRQRERETPWTMFSEPHPTDAVWEVGIRRRTEAGVVLDRRALRSLDPDDELEIAVAEEECKLKAKRWTESKIGF